LCDSERVDLLYRFESQRSLCCDSCGCHYNEPGRDTDALYDRSYYDRNYVPQSKERLARFREVAARIVRYVPSGSVLDYGCGPGFFLRAMRERGFRANVGADVSRDALALARAHVGEGDQLVHLRSECLPDRRFDVIALMDSISHIADPRETLERLRDRHLEAGGVLVIRTPDIPDSYYYRILALSRLLGPRRTSSLLFARARYVLFDRSILSRYLHDLGFVVVHESRVADRPPLLATGSLSGVAKNLAQRFLQAGIHSVLVVARAEGATSAAGGVSAHRPPA
jgi:2-polyprenyl-3-methyl-5-hydroxy-6-metoxy-1,4-benzoquinol methylase